MPELTAAQRRSRRFARHYHSAAYLRAVKALPCVVCRKRPCHAHHEPTKGAGGTWRNLVPLCFSHHQERHQLGVSTFQTKHSVDLLEEVERVYNYLESMRTRT